MSASCPSPTPSLFPQYFLNSSAVYVSLYIHMFAGAMQRMLSESCYLRLLQEAREAKTQILVSETCRRCFMSYQYIWFWTVSSTFWLCLHLVSTSVLLIWSHMMVRQDGLLSVLTFVSKVSLVSRFQDTFSDFKITSITYYDNVLLVHEQKTDSKLQCLIVRCVDSPVFSFCLNPSFSSFSLDSLDKKFDQVLSLQQLDKSKAISQILQEVTIQFTNLQST